MLFMCVIISSDGFSRTVNGYTSLGNANVLRTVILPISVKFHFFHLFIHCWNDLILGIKFNECILFYRL